MEQVVMEISAVLEGAGGLGQGKLRVTTDRLTFERKKLFGGSGDVTSFPLSSIQAAGISGVMEKKLRVRAGSTELVFKSALITSGDADLKAISNLLQRAIAGQPLGSPDQTVVTVEPVAPTSAVGQQTTPSSSNAWLDELERLTKLRTVGALSDAEFEQAKRKLLNG